MVEVTCWAVVGNRLRAEWELGTSLPNRRPIVVIKESHRRAMNRRLRPASRLRCVFERRSDADFSGVIEIQAGERRSSHAQDIDLLRPRVQFRWAGEWREGSLRPRRIVGEHESTAL